MVVLPNRLIFTLPIWRSTVPFMNTSLSKCVVLKFFIGWRWFIHPISSGLLARMKIEGKCLILTARFFARVHLVWVSLRTKYAEVPWERRLSRKEMRKRPIPWVSWYTVSFSVKIGRRWWSVWQRFSHLALKRKLVNNFKCTFNWVISKV